VQRLLVGLTVLLLALAVPTAAQAQRGGGGGGGRGGGGGGGRGGFGGGYGRGGYGYGGYGRGGYGYGGFGGFYGGLYLGYPYFGGGYDDGYPYYASPPSSSTYLNGSSPYALGPSEGRPAYYGPSDQSNSALPPAPVGNTANIRVILPDPNAKVLVDDTPTVSTGPIRTLATPELTPGQTFHYNLTITVDDGTRTISEKRRIDVTAGNTTVVDFTRPPVKAKP
jgi:uncharacterized protein (TIGR03000 family)